ncbi:MAG: hypothetical protein ACLU2T_00400 [Bifidobacterium adolescentis]
MSSATVAATDNRTRCDAIRHWLTPHRLHCIVLAAYVIVVGTVMCFHEPWFDEAQAWLIARDCSWREMILERPHYEGHPPLWWMMLAAPAKLGVPYEIGLKSINLACATLMIWLLEFKTKLPEPFKVILPFSYFLCYQYGVTSRPYALMVAAMLLVAINWKTRDEKPWREVLSMMLLCLTSSYGLVIAGMFAANWVVRFVRQEHSLIRNRQRFAALLALLAAAVVILIDVMPAKDVYSGNFDISGMTQPAPLWIQICNSWLLLPAEALFTSTVSDTNLVFIGLSPTLLYTGTVSCLMWAPLIHISRRRHNAMLLLSSYTVMCLVFAQHFSMHHLGILLGFFIAVLAIDCDERRISTDDWPAMVHHHGRPIHRQAWSEESAQLSHHAEGPRFRCHAHQRVLDDQRQHMRHTIRVFLIPDGGLVHQDQSSGAIPLDGWLDSHQFHECVPGRQGTNQSRRLLRRWQGLHRLHIMDRRDAGNLRPLFRPHAHGECI